MSREERTVKVFEGVLREATDGHWILTDRRQVVDQDIVVTAELRKVEGMLVKITLEYER